MRAQLACYKCKCFQIWLWSSVSVTETSPRIFNVVGHAVPSFFTVHVLAAFAMHIGVANGPLNQRLKDAISRSQNSSKQSGRCIEARVAGLSGSDAGIWCFKVEDGVGVQFNIRWSIHKVQYAIQVNNNTFKYSCTTMYNQVRSRNTQTDDDN